MGKKKITVRDLMQGMTDHRIKLADKFAEGGESEREKSLAVQAEANLKETAEATYEEELNAEIKRLKNEDKEAN
jgi:hypothetical protein